MASIAELFDSAIAQHRAGNVGEAEALYRQVLQHDRNHIDACNNLSVIAKNAGQLDEAFALISNVTRQKPDSPAGHYNLALLQEKMRDLNGAASSYLRALEADAKYMDALKNLGSLLIRTGNSAAALPYLERAVAAMPRDRNARFNFAVALRLENRIDEAAEHLHAAVTAEPDFLMAWLELLFIAMQACDFDLTATARRQIDAIVASTGCSGLSVEALCNMHYLAVLEGTSPEAAHAAAAEIVRCLGQAPPNVIMAPERHMTERRSTGDRLKIGYLSANFGNQAIGHVSRRLYESHDRRRFHIHAYGLTDRSREPAPFHGDIRRGVETFRDVYDRDADGIATQIRADGIDILINLDGHMSGPGIRVMALRPAPVQMFWLGVAGTPGLPYHDYVVADRIVVPDGEQRNYPEAIVRLPVYHCADRHEIAAEPPSREAEGLPEDALVLCAFNNTQKIERRIFACWMEILKAVPHSVLWLSKGDAPALVERLRGAAAAHGVDGKRLVFARIEWDKTRHLRRHDLADLFLDTLTLNASTTALDALSTGLPMITCPGTTWPSRIAASFLTTLGLGDFIVSDLVQYRRMALDLCGNPDLRAEARRRFEAARSTSPLFDIKSFTAHLEAAYAEIWQRHQAGSAPAGFDVAPISTARRLQIGGSEPKPGWQIVDEGADLGALAERSIEEIYASQIYQRLDARDTLPRALAAAHRVLQPGGVLRISVPDLETLRALILNPLVPEDERGALSRHLFGDGHRTGLTFDWLADLLRHAGFATVRRVETFGLFDDASSVRRFGVLLSLNVEAVK